MKDIYFDANHDVTLLNSDLRMTTDGEYTKQKLTIVLQFYFSEWFLNTSKGIPYAQSIFEAGLEYTDLYNYFWDKIRNTESVEKINSLDIVINKANRTCLITTQVNGSITVTVEVSP